MYQKKQMWALTYVNKAGETKTCYPKSEEQKNENLGICRERGLKVVSCKKLYPFNTYANQHNFMLVRNICSNRMNDMQVGEMPYDEAEYERLEAMKEKADRLFELPLPTAWLPWEDWKDAKELSTLAVVERQEACVEAGRADLVEYC